MTGVEDLFAGRPEAGRLHEAVARIGPAATRPGKSQIGFRRRRGFAWTWRPDLYLSGQPAPLVLSVALPRRDPSPRWKEVVEPAPGRFMHHLELRRPDEVDAEVEAWLREAWEAAG